MQVRIHRWNDICKNYDHPYRQGRITKQAQTGVRYWIDSIYENAWKKQQDEWIIREGMLMMLLDGIKFIVLPSLLWPFDANNRTQWRDAFPAIIPDHYIMLDPQQSPQAVCGNNRFSGEDPGYHSSPAGQQIIADNFYQHWLRHFA